MANNNSSGGSFLLAFLIGAVAGAAVALLYAPASGDETRRKLAEKAKQGRARAEEAIRDGREFVERQRDRVVEAAERGRDAFEQARRDAL